VIDIAADASVQMTIQEMSTAVQHELPIKIFILNNQYMGKVRQWQQLLHGNRLSHSYSEALPDFRQARGRPMAASASARSKPSDLDGAIKEMISVKRPVLFDCRVAALENCFPMIPSGQGAQRNAVAGAGHRRGNRHRPSPRQGLGVSMGMSGHQVPHLAPLAGRGRNSRQRNSGEGDSPRTEISW